MNFRKEKIRKYTNVVTASHSHSGSDLCWLRYHYFKQRAVPDGCLNHRSLRPLYVQFSSNSEPSFPDPESNFTCFISRGTDTVSWLGKTNLHEYDLLIHWWEALSYRAHHDKSTHSFSSHSNVTRQRQNIRNTELLKWPTKRTSRLANNIYGSQQQCMLHVRHVSSRWPIIYTISFGVPREIRILRAGLVDIESRLISFAYIIFPLITKLNRSPRNWFDAAMLRSSHWQTRLTSLKSIFNVNDNCPCKHAQHVIRVIILIGFHFISFSSLLAFAAIHAANFYSRSHHFTVSHFACVFFFSFTCTHRPRQQPPPHSQEKQTRK